MIVSKLVLALGMAGLLSLALPALARPTAVTPPFEIDAENVAFKRLRAGDVSLLIPSGAKVGQDSYQQIHIAGPELSLQAADNWTLTDFSYALSIIVAGAS